MSGGIAVGEYEFKGLSTDTKPTTCGVNSLFLELDSGDVYYYIGFMADFELDDSSLYSNQGNTTGNYIDVLTYKGLATMTSGGIYVATTQGMDLFIDIDSMVLTGSIVYDEDSGLFNITGNCAITAPLTDEPPK